MLVSLITVSFNSEATIKDTIESVLNQTYDNLEYIIIDGASTDNTVQIAESYREKLEEKGVIYKVLSEKDNGIYDAMNKGVRLSSGEIVGIINSDDWYEPIAVETAVNVYNEEKYGWFFADLNVYKKGKVILKPSKQSKYMTTRNWNHPTSFISRELYSNMTYGGYSMYDDYDLFLRANRAGYKIVNRNIVLANYRFGGTSTKHSFKRMLKCISYRYKNYRRNGYGVFYIFECVMTEFAKYLIG